MFFKRTIYDKFLSWKNETNGKKARNVGQSRGGDPKRCCPPYVQ